MAAGQEQGCAANARADKYELKPNSEGLNNLRAKNSIRNVGCGKEDSISVEC